MRHAAQLCRGLAEAARSLERPYVPRHVPLPSSSYSAAAQSPALPSPPRPDALGGKGEAEPQRAANIAQRLGRGRLRDSVSTGSSSRIHDSRAKTRQPPIAQASLVRKFEAPLQVDSNRSWTQKRQKGVRNSRAVDVKQKWREDGRTGTRPEGGSILPAYVQAKLKRLKAVYPSLSQEQALLLWRTFERTRTFRTYRPQALISWYEDHVWTNERQTADAPHIESAASLCMLLRYAYLRNDLRSLLRVEARAVRSAWLAKDRHRTTAAPGSTKQLGGSEADGVAIWPVHDEDPRRLAHNLKLALAARDGDWIKVEQLLDAHRVARNGGSYHELDAVGWGSLLRFGLGSVETLPKPIATPQPVEEPAPSKGSARKKQPRKATIAEVSVETKERVEEPNEDGDEKRLQAEARVSLTKRLVPQLLRQTRARQDAADEAPGWLLESVLTQLLEHGKSDAVLRIVRLALAETGPQQDPSVRGGSTGMLNLALAACVQDRRITLAETLRVFNSITGSSFGRNLAGRSKQPEGKGEIVPNEESLVLVLKKVRHPLFRASWSRKLLDEFMQRWPHVRLTGRSYRIVLDLCATAPPKPTPDSHAREGGERKVPVSESAPGRARKVIVKATLLERTLLDILTQFESNPRTFHRTTTNRFRFNYTLINLRRIVKLKLASNPQSTQLNHIIHLIHRLQHITRKPPTPKFPAD
ncbi:uncharacterized protein PSANT_01787 [Moesziomyces antarcticus]|uniref:Uncharacterized protein n=2 Tax=Pseudozyma antarctica TaxID=84753 RepID=A0A5C3FI83_PSEA2|nr:uncharacterized protein PSANT_01787 [Moesziomyces antarcticus]